MIEYIMMLLTGKIKLSVACQLQNRSAMLTFWERSSNRASKHLKLRLWTAILMPPNLLSPLL